MDQITNLKAISMLPSSDGIIFAYCAEELEDMCRVGFKMVSFSSGKVSSVTKSIYMLTKFGVNYKTFANKIKNYLTCFSILLDDGQTFIVERDGSAILFDADGKELWTGKMLYKNTAPGGIAPLGGSLWASFPEYNVLVRYNLKTLRQELRIGGENSPFQKTVGIFPAGSKLFVCNSGSNSVWKLDTTNYATELLHQLDFPVYDYLFINNYEIILTDSGLYLI